VKTLDSRTMRVTFIKTGPRRYGVLVERDRWPDVGVNPAPGYDDYLTHDLLHFVAEAEWRMDGAVFGQLASGGDAGIFLPLDPELLTQTVRDRKRRKRLSAKPKGRRSELLTGVLETAWAARRGLASLPADWEEQLAAARVVPSKLERVVDRLDEIAGRWHKLHVGEGLTFDWPRPESRHRKPLQRANSHH